MQEEWKNIPYAEGYQVSNFGRVRNREKGNILKKEIINSGYERVSLPGVPNNGKQLVHRMVATAFIPNKENKNEVHHIDGVKTNNRVDNLAWVTTRENKYFNKELGLENTETARKALLDVQKKAILQYDLETGEYVAEYESIKKAAKVMSEKTGETFSTGHISQVANGKRKHHRGYIWVFKNPEHKSTQQRYKRVTRTDKEGHKHTFRGISEAARSVGKDRSTLLYHYNKKGSNFTMWGYAWNIEV